MPKGQILLFIALNYPTELVKGLLDVSGFNETLKGAFSHTPMNGQDYSGLFKGDFNLAVVKADEIADDDSLSQKLGGIQLFLTGSIADKAKFEKMVESFRSKADSSASSGGKAAAFLGGLKKGLQYNDNTFVLSLSPQAASKFLSSPASGAPDWIQSYASGSSFFSLDLKSLFSFALAKKGSPDDPKMQELIEGLDRIVSYGGSYGDGHLNNRVEIRFSDKNENSLKQLVNLVGIAAESGMRQKTGSK